MATSSSNLQFSRLLSDLQVWAKDSNQIFLQEGKSGAASISPYFALTPYIDIDPPSKLMNNNHFNNQGRICHHEDRKVIISKHHNDVAVDDDDDAKKEGWKMKMKV